MYLVAGIICLFCCLLHISNFITSFSEARDAQYLSLGLIAWPVPGIVLLIWSDHGRRWSHPLIWHGHLAVLIGLWFMSIESAHQRDRRFFALLSHEMCTPLAGLLGFLDLLQGINLRAVWGFEAHFPLQHDIEDCQQ